MIRSAKITYGKATVVFLVDEKTHERVAADLYCPVLLQPLRIADTEEAIALAKRIGGTS